VTVVPGSGLWPPSFPRARGGVPARAKLNLLPPRMLAFFRQLPVVGRPKEAVPRVRAMLDAGFRSVIFVVFPFDTEMPCLLAERVRPAVVDASERSPSHYETPRFEPDS
jgi:hypothetical protein